MAMKLKLLTRTPFNAKRVVVAFVEFGRIFSSHRAIIYLFIYSFRTTPTWHSQSEVRMKVTARLEVFICIEYYSIWA